MGESRGTMPDGTSGQYARPTMWAIRIPPGAAAAAQQCTLCDDRCARLGLPAPKRCFAGTVVSRGPARRMPPRPLRKASRIGAVPRRSPLRTSASGIDPGGKMPINCRHRQGPSAKRRKRGGAPPRHVDWTRFIRQRVLINTFGIGYVVIEVTDEHLIIGDGPDRGAIPLGAIRSLRLIETDGSQGPLLEPAPSDA